MKVAALDRAASKLRVFVRVLILTVVVVAGDVACRFRMRRSRSPVLAALDSLQALSGRLIRALGLDIVRHGEPPTGQVLIVANHRSYVDIPLVLAHAPAVFLAKHEIGDWPLFGKLARLASTVFVVREDPESRRRALVALADRLDAGLPVALFPEGTTSFGPGLTGFRAGSFRLAAERGIAVVPVAICYGDRRDSWVGDDDFVRHFLERFAEPSMRVTISFGPALYGSDGIELAVRAERWIREELRPLDRAVFAQGAAAEREESGRLVAVGA